ncbi:hypothetical protein LCGC14_0477630 [marine sediment metagenome]|uniref:Uncharacterized protein n=1 Tax=marine sediment metagenome TaxID=412755 RepID=A0A0F9STB7_9ZZZZ
MEENLSHNKEVEWNLSAGIVGEIQNLLNTANRLYINGNILKAFWCLKSVKFRFIQSLEKDERKELRKTEKTFYEEREKSNRNKMTFYYEEYNEKIMDLLDEYGYLIPKKKDSKRIS